MFEPLPGLPARKPRVRNAVDTGQPSRAHRRVKHGDWIRRGTWKYPAWCRYQLARCSPGQRHRRSKCEPHFSPTHSLGPMPFCWHGLLNHLEETLEPLRVLPLFKGKNISKGSHVPKTTREKYNIFQVDVSSDFTLLPILLY